MLDDHPSDTASPLLKVERPSGGAVLCGALLAVSPFDLAIPENGFGPLFVRPLMILTALVALAVLVLTDRSRPNRSVVLWLCLLVIGSGVASTASPDPSLGFSVTLRLAVLALVVVAASSVVRSAADIHALAVGAAAGLALAGSIGVVVRLHGSDLLGTDRFLGSISSPNGVDRLTRPFSHSNVAAMYLAPATALVMTAATTARRRAWTTILSAVALFGVLAVSLTLSRGGNAALAIALVLVGSARFVKSGRRRIAIALGALVVSVAVLAPLWATRADDSPRASLSSMSRTEIWEQGWDAFSSNLLSGVGPGQFSAFSVADLADDPFGAPQGHAHNLVLELAATGGLLVLVPLVGFLLASSKSVGFATLRSPTGLVLAAPLLVISIHSMVDYPLVFSSSGNLVAIVLGATLGHAAQTNLARNDR